MAGDLPHLIVLRQQRDTIIHTVDIKKILPNLRSNECISQEDYERVTDRLRNEGNTPAAKLLFTEILGHNPDSGSFVTLLKVLKESSQTDLAGLLEDKWKECIVITTCKEETKYRVFDEEHDQMAVDDAMTRQPPYYDAFVSYCHNDFPFVQEMIRELETNHGLKLCINARDLLISASQQFVTAKLIAERCHKVILVMSPSFLRSPECEFQVKVALSLSPGAKSKFLVPVMYKWCTMPIVLHHICCIDYTKSTLNEYFWGHLAGSLKRSPGERVSISQEDLSSLNNMTYDTEKDNDRSAKQDANLMEKNNLTDSDAHDVALSQQTLMTSSPQVTINYAEESNYRELTEEADQVVTDSPTEQPHYFDAFVSYCQDDWPFVQEMIRMLETIHGLKLCINARDLTGAPEPIVTARLIADRCHKVILVMSPSFLRSPECEFQVKVAMSLSLAAKKMLLVPVLYKCCKVPIALQYIAVADYTKSTMHDWFWGCLAESLHVSHKDRSVIPQEDLDSLNNVAYDLKKDGQHDHQDHQLKNYPSHK